MAVAPDECMFRPLILTAWPEVMLETWPGRLACRRQGVAKEQSAWEATERGRVLEALLCCADELDTLLQLLFADACMA
eukprot:1148616-Pelagomonas_calceolata.AAC.3